MEAKYLLEDGNNVMVFQKFSAVYNYNEKSIKNAMSMDIIKGVSWKGSYQRWCEIRSKERPTFNLFAYTMGNTDNILEVPVATIIQCIEGYMRVHHKEAVTKFPKEVKRDLKALVENYLKYSVEWKEKCEINRIDDKAISKSITNMLGNINQMSLKELFNYAINRSYNTKIIFQYEMEHFTDDGICCYDIFLKKITGHRNWLSHLMEQKYYFIKDENILAKEKLGLLFRVIMMEDIKLPINKDSLIKVVELINSWYDKHQLTYKRKLNK